MIELGLSGTELLVYAVIVSFSKNGEGLYYGTRTELCKMCGVYSKRSIDKALHKLVKDGHIVRQSISRCGHLFYAYSLPMQQSYKGSKLIQGDEQLKRFTMSLRNTGTGPAPPRQPRF